MKLKKIKLSGCKLSLAMQPMGMGNVRTPPPPRPEFYTKIKTTQNTKLSVAVPEIPHPFLVNKNK